MSTITTYRHIRLPVLRTGDGDAHHYFSQVTKVLGNGVTLRFDFSPVAGTLEVTYALCSGKDRFDKAEGRKLVDSRYSGDNKFWFCGVYNRALTLPANAVLLLANEAINARRELPNYELERLLGAIMFHSNGDLPMWVLDDNFDRRSVEAVFQAVAENGGT